MTSTSLFVVLMFAAAATTTFAKDSYDGEWIGVVEQESHISPLRLHIEKNSGTITMPVLRLFEARMTKLQLEGSNVSFAFEKEQARVVFTGTREGNGISGNYDDGTGKGKFQVQRLATVAPEKYFGTYESTAGDHLYIRTWDELGPNQLTYFDDRGNIGALFAASATSFTSGAGIWIPLPAKVQATFQLNAAGEATEVMWSENGSTPRAFKKTQSHREEEVSVKNGDVTLGGSLVIPSGGKGPFPAVILVHGSGPVTRDFFGPIAYLFAKKGFAVLSYDKRGNGKSSGDWLQADFHDLASDALAGVAFLKSRAQIDPKKIGLLGISQGGWVVPLAVSKSPDIAFAILISTPAVSPARQEMQRAEEEMKVQGATADQIKEALGKLAADLDSLRQPQTVDALHAEVEKAKSEGNEALLKANGAENPQFLLFYQRIMDFDPLPILQKMYCPTLVLYGEADRGVPVQGNLEQLVGALKQAPNARYFVKVFPKGNHALLLSETGSYEEFFHLNRFVPDFFPTLIDWLRQR